MISTILSAMFLFAAPAPVEEGTVSVTIPADAYSVLQDGSYHQVVMDGFGRLPEPGMPSLPARIFAVAVPPGAEVTDVRFFSEGGIELDGRYDIAPIPLPRVLSQENPAAYARDLEAYEKNISEIFFNDAHYPPSPGSFVRFAGFRRYNLVDVRITPFSYNPETGKLIYHPRVTVQVDYLLGPSPNAVKDCLPRTEALARKIVFNYSQAQSWYSYAGSLGGRGTNDYVIITLDTLTDAVQPLVAWEEEKGRTVEVVTTDWIAANYSGYDLAEKMRNFLRDKYPSAEWGIEDVLIVGHYHDVPMRRCSQNLGYGMPETDFYYAELSKQDSNSWDKDGDHKWGENSDPIDFYGEVNVGRIPWSEESTVLSICCKSVVFENNDDPSFKNNILLLGAYFWANTDNAVLMEYKTDPGLHPWMSDWTMTRMYEKNSGYYSSYPCDFELLHKNVMSEWPSGKYAFVNWAGHGSPVSCHIYGLGAPYFIADGDTMSLNDDYPGVIFADACSNSETDSLTSIGREMIKQGAVGFLGATKVAYGMGGWSKPSHGSSQSFDYYFTTCVTSENYTQGQAHQWSLTKMYTDGLWSSNKYETFEWGALFGNPDLGFEANPALSMSFPQGLPSGFRFPGLSAELIVEIKDSAQQYVPNSGMLHYRYDPEDDFTVVPLTALGNDLFEAELPVTEPGDEPEYYFRAQGDQGSFFCSPFCAPYTTHSFDVCLTDVAIEDDFESDMGWTVFNWFVDDGWFERADPVGTYSGGDPVQPEDDHSEHGTKCFVTGKDGGSPGNDDLDGSLTMLISPEFDLPNDGYISFALWFYHGETGLKQPFEVWIANGDGYMMMVMKINHKAKWRHVEFKASDYVPPTDDMKVYFRVMDNGNDDIVEALIDDFKVERLVPDPALWSDAYTVSESNGADTNFFLDAGVANASRGYILLGSISGTEPGLPLPGNQATLPLNWDVFMSFVLNNLNSSWFFDFMGTLDSEGRATAHLDLGPLSGITGLKFCFAYLLQSPYDFVSNALIFDVVD